MRESLSLYTIAENHVNFDSGAPQEEYFRSIDTLMDSHPHLKLADVDRQPEHIAKVLRKFLRGDWDSEDNEEDFMLDKVLLEFPVFALNEDFMRALANVIMMKVDSAVNLIN